MKAKDYLNQIVKIEEKIKNKIIEADHWKSIASGITGTSDAERVQTSRNGQRMADSICKYIQIEEEINRLIDEKQNIIETIEKLPADEYCVIHGIYVQFEKLEAIAVNQKKSLRWVNYRHQRGLANIQRILNEQSK